MGMMSKIGRVPELAMRQVECTLAGSTMFGDGRYCPICDKHSNRFLDFGVPPRPEVQCPHCRSLERHRVLWRFLQERTDFFGANPGKMLHVAPEKSFRKKIVGKFTGSYVTADLFAADVDVKMDIQDIQFPDGHFDMILCSHVLEHVEDDRKAMRELHRVLAADGWAILLVPITTDVTFEDPSITDPKERLKHFGQEDHVRRYGPDYVDRLREEGFAVESVGPSDLFPPALLEQTRLTAHHEIHFCTK